MVGRLSHKLLSVNTVHHSIQHWNTITPTTYTTYSNSIPKLYILQNFLLGHLFTLFTPFHLHIHFVFENFVKFLPWQKCWENLSIDSMLFRLFILRIYAFLPAICWITLCRIRFFKRNRWRMLNFYGEFSNCLVQIRFGSKVWLNCCSIWIFFIHRFCIIVI